MYNDEYNGDRDGRLEELLRAGHTDEAVVLLEAWYAQEPWNSEVLMRLAVVHWLAGQPARTLRALDELLTLEPENAEAMARRAQALLMLGKREDAEDSLRKAEALDPNTPGVLLNRGLLQELQGEYEQAIASMTAYLEIMPQDHLALARRSHLHRQIGNYPQSLTDALAAVALQPDDPETHYAEALAYVTLEQGDEALEACDRCLHLQPAFFPALRLKIDLLADLARIPEAEAALTLLEQVDPQAAQTILLQSRLAAERGQFERALALINQYLEDNPDEPYGYYRRGMVYFKHEDFAQALADFRAYAELAPHALEAYEQQFLCNLELGQVEEAVQVGEAALHQHPANARLHYNLGFARLLLDDQQTALADFQQAVQRAPDDAEIALRIHLALAEFTPPEVRLRWFQQAVNAFSHPSALLYGLLAEAYLDTGDSAQAIQQILQALAEDDSMPFTYILGVKAYSLLGRYPEALALAERGVTRLPEDSRVRLARAMVLRDSGYPVEALEELAVVQSMQPQDAEVVRQQAMVFGSIGEVGEALRLIDEAVHMDPGNAEALFWQSYFALHAKQYHDALAAANRLLSIAPDAPEGHLLRGIALAALKRQRDAEKEVAWARAHDPSLYERLSKDPVVSELLASLNPTRLARWLRRTALR
jgi:tetratricopeptide (TPR) repeat protein